MNKYILLILVLFLVSCETYNNDTIDIKKENIVFNENIKKNNIKKINFEKEKIVKKTIYKTNKGEIRNNKKIIEIGKEGKKLDDVYISYSSFVKVDCDKIFNISIFPHFKKKVLLYNGYCKKEKKEELDIIEKNNSFTLDKCKGNSICELGFSLKQNKCDLLKDKKQRNKCKRFKILNEERKELYKVNNFRVEEYLK